MDYEKEYKELLDDYHFLLKKHSELQTEHIGNLKQYIKLVNITLPILKDYNNTEKFFRQYVITTTTIIVFFIVLIIYYFCLIL